MSPTRKPKGCSMRLRKNKRASKKTYHKNIQRDKLKRLGKTLNELQKKQNYNWKMDRQLLIDDLSKKLSKTKAFLEAEKRKTKQQVKKELYSRKTKKDAGSILTPPDKSEFEVHADLYNEIRAIPSLVVRGDVIAYTTQGNLCRFDLVVYRKNKRAPHDPMCIIEVKKKGSSMGIKQKAKYESFGLPVLECDGSRQIHETLDRLLEVEADFLKKDTVSP